MAIERQCNVAQWPQQNSDVHQRTSHMKEKICEMVLLGLLVVNGMVSVPRRVATGVESAAPEGIEVGLTVCFVANVLFAVHCGVCIAFGSPIADGLGRLWRGLREKTAMEGASNNSGRCCLLRGRWCPKPQYGKRSFFCASLF